MKNKIFIFTDAYTARIFLYCFKFISVYSEFEFIFLSETDAFIKMQTESVINTCETLQECVENSTEILIVKNKYIPDNKINFIIDLAQTQNKRYIVFPGWDDNSEKGDDICFTSHLPSILLCYLDNKIEVSCWESAINKLLIDSNYKVYQRKTSEFKFILNLLKSCNIINEKILCDKFSSLPDCNIVVNTIQYKINSYLEMSEIFSKMNPSVLIVVVGNNNINYKEIENVFKYRHGRKIDLFAKSEVLEYLDESGKRSVILNFLTNNEIYDKMIRLSDPFLISQLSAHIFEKFALPNGVILVPENK